MWDLQRQSMHHQNQVKSKIQYHVEKTESTNEVYSAWMKGCIEDART